MASKDQSTLFPVRGDHSPNAIIGLALKTAKGWRIFDRQDKEVGTFDDFSAGRQTLLEKMTPAETTVRLDGTEKKLVWIILVTILANGLDERQLAAAFCY
jgi:hypothetical protein